MHTEFNIEMDIEVVDFFTIERDDEKQTPPGSLHVYLPEIDADLRGFLVKKRKNSWFFGLPSLLGKDPETGNKIRFPVFAFVNRDKTEKLRSLIREKGGEYIAKNILNHPAK